MFSLTWVKSLIIRHISYKKKTFCDDFYWHKEQGLMNVLFVSVNFYLRKCWKTKKNGETVKSLASDKVLFLFVPFL